MNPFSLNNDPPENLPFHPLRGNMFRLFLENFKLILFFVPFLLLLRIGLVVGNFSLILLALLALIPAGPALAAMYDIGYQLSRQIPSFEMRGFFTSYRANWKQGTATMAIQLPLYAIMILAMMVDGERPVWMMPCLALGCYLLITFSIYSYSQIALVALPLAAIWKNALLLPMATGLTGLLLAALHLALIAAFWAWIGWMSIPFVFLGPATLVAWTSWKLFPKLEEALLRHE